MLSRTSMTLKNGASVCPACYALWTNDYMDLTHDFAPWSLDFNPTVNANESRHDDEVYSYDGRHDTSKVDSFTLYDSHAASCLASNGIAIFDESLGHDGESDLNMEILGLQENIFDRELILAPGHIPTCNTQGFEPVNMGPLDTSIDTEGITTSGFCATFPSTGPEKPGIGQSGFYSDSTAIKMPQFFNCTDECFLFPLDMSTAIDSPSMATSGNILAYGELESLQAFGQLPTSHPCLDESALVLTDIFDMRGYYGMETEVPDDPQVGKLKPKSRNRSPLNNY
ncbi:hypothetical protein PENARI_c004G02978 [Penicillium arizonense]|uniref:Uncharacterized protein n=1 Tax=Penicillium arizonense TaxID=1835702 RepID=A0A1F5LQK9_PENAI|nr:hypothetical protein PENARI_c004G02978 [Penicillium arizonense]OGE55493.1 hypothetical protein PENARI_c004G02978 [Penicillium arizonense]